MNEQWPPFYEATHLHLGEPSEYRPPVTAPFVVAVGHEAKAGFNDIEDALNYCATIENAQMWTAEEWDASKG